MSGREVYEQTFALAAELGAPIPDWEALEPQQRMDWELLATELSQKAVADHEASKITEIPYA